MQPPSRASNGVRRWIAVFGLALLFIHGFFMPAADVQAAVSNILFSASAATIPVSFSGTVASGGAVIGVAKWDGGSIADLTSVTDDQGNTYSIIDSQQRGSSTMIMFYLYNITNAPITVTVNLGTARTVRGIAIREASGLGTTDPLDGFTVHNVSSSAAIGTDNGNSGSYDTRWDGAYVFAGILDASGGLGANTFSAGTGFSGISQAGDGTHTSLATEYQIQTNAGSCEAWFTLTGSSSSCVCWVAAFVPSKPTLTKLIQTTANGKADAAATTWAHSFKAVVQSGSTVMGIVTYGGATSNLSTIDDDKSNSYTIVRRLRYATADQSAATFYLHNITNGPITLTFHFGGSTAWVGVSMREVAGLVNAAPDKEIGQVQSPAPGTGADACTSTAVTPTEDGEYIFGGFSDTNMRRRPFSVGTNFTNFSLCGNYQGSGSTTSWDRVGVCSEQLIQGTAASISATATENFSDVVISMIMAFKTATGGGATPVNADISDSLWV